MARGRKKIFNTPQEKRQHYKEYNHKFSKQYYIKVIKQIRPKIKEYIEKHKDFIALKQKQAQTRKDLHNLRLKLTREYKEQNKH